MMYKLNYNGVEITLPKCTLDIQEQIDKITLQVNKRTQSTRYLAELMYNLTITLIGEEKVFKIFECTSLEDIDLKELEIFIIHVMKKYGERVIEASVQKNLDEINKLTTNPKISKLIELATASK